MERTQLAESTMDQLQAALGSAYTIERELGRGGMATVYLARDNKHQRLVALKVLHSDLAASLGPERFRREITTAAQFQHPHILGVHDSGETADGLLWFTMPYVEGETLRSRLRRDRQLPIEDVVRITREIAGALDYAHEAGVIHRDIKPENILLTKRGDALLADFGIARALAEGAPAAGAQAGGLTMTGLAIGTPQYMSPEQASGERTLDARSDVYSLAIVCYEMLAGEPPFTGPSQQIVIAKMLTMDAPSVRVLRPGVSPQIEAVLAKALARVPADRWSSAEEFSRALAIAEHPSHESATVSTASAANTLGTAAARKTRRPVPVAALALVLGLVIGGGLLFAWRSKSASSTAADASAGSTGVRLAVLPFDNLGDTSEAYFADGVTDAVRGKLAGVPGLAVIGSTSSAQYRHTTKTPQQIGDELGVRYMLIGKVRWVKGSNGASTVQVSPELVDVRTATDAWAAPFNAPITDVFQVQADIADKVARNLQVALTPAAKLTIADQPTSDVAAYDAELRAQKVIAEGGASLITVYRRAVALEREAVQRDPNFALAWAHLAVYYANLKTNFVADAALKDSADVASARAIALSPHSAAAHRARAVYYESVDIDNAKALAENETALAIAPSDPRYLIGMSDIETKLGRWDSAVDHMQRAVRVDPRNAAFYIALGEAQTRLRHFTEARASLEHSVALQPARVDAWEDLSAVALGTGNLEEARGRLATALASGDTAGTLAYFATNNDLGWIFDSAQERTLLASGVAAFDGSRTQWAIVHAEQYARRHDVREMKIWADTGRLELERELKIFPNDAQRLAFHGLMLAYLGHSEEAVSEGRRAVKLLPLTLDAQNAPYVLHQLARIYLACGQLDAAMDVVEQVLAVPYDVSTGWVRIDPEFAKLKGNPRFEKILASAKPAA